MLVGWNLATHLLKLNEEVLLGETFPVLNCFFLGDFALTFGRLVIIRVTAVSIRIVLWGDPEVAIRTRDNIVIKLPVAFNECCISNCRFGLGLFSQSGFKLFLQLHKAFSTLLCMTWDHAEAGGKEATQRATPIRVGKHWDNRVAFILVLKMAGCFVEAVDVLDGGVDDVSQVCTHVVGVGNSDSGSDSGSDSDSDSGGVTVS